MAKIGNHENFHIFKARKIQFLYTFSDEKNYLPASVLHCFRLANRLYYAILYTGSSITRSVIRHHKNEMFVPAGRLYVPGNRVSFVSLCIRIG